MFRFKPRPLLPLAWLCALSIPALLVAEQGLGERYGWSALLLYLPQQPFALLPLLGLIWSLRNRMWRPALGNLGALALFWCLLAGWHGPLPGEAAPVAPDGGFRLITYNIHEGRAGVAALAATIRAQHADIVCLQEVVNPTHRPERDPVAGLRREFPGWTLYQAREVATLTRFPVEEQKVYGMPKPGRRQLLATRLRTPQGPVTVLNTHISTAPEQAKLDKEAPWGARLIRLVKTARGSSVIRRQQLPVIFKAQDESKSPWILAGDFNNPPRGHFYGSLASRGQDAFAQAGHGFGFTFPARFPLLRIDYCWLGRGIKPIKCVVPNSGTSDHRPVVVRFGLTAS